MSNPSAHPLAFKLIDSGHHPLLFVVQQMFEEYQTSLGIDLGFQNFASELAQLPGAYAPPRGRLYLGLLQDQAAVCGALRPHDPTTVEMKRLYVRPQHRGTGCGLQMVQTLIAAAKQMGYSRMVLDTLPSMHAAQHLYLRLGFQDTAAYTFNPIQGTRFLELTL